MTTPAALRALAEGDIGNAIIASSPGGIEQQERQGQADMVRTADRLPILMGHDMCKEKIAAATGIVFGEPVDDIFLAVTLPAGWSIKATGHSMWSDLIDDKGRKRAGIFYKAAFYDRSARLHMNARYITAPRHDEEGKTARFAVIDSATGEPVWQSEAYAADDYKTSEKYEREARVWREKNFPDHADPFAYWD